MVGPVAAMQARDPVNSILLGATFCLGMLVSVTLSALARQTIVQSTRLHLRAHNSMCTCLLSIAGQDWPFDINTDVVHYGGSSSPSSAFTEPAALPQCSSYLPDFGLPNSVSLV